MTYSENQAGYVVRFLSGIQNGLTFYFGLMPVSLPYHLMKTLWLTSQRASSIDQVHVTAIVRS